MIPFFSSLLQRVIIRELVQTFLLCVVALLTLILISRGLQMRDLFLGLQLQLLDVGVLFFYMLPSFLSLILPISCMLSVFLTFLRMSTDRELIALKAGGVSVYQMLAAPALFSFLCMCLALFISLFGISWGMGNFRSMILDIANTRAKVVIEPGVFNPDIPGTTLFARKVDPKTGELLGVIFEDRQRSEGSTITILAPRGEIINDNDKGQLVFSLYDGRIYRVDGSAFSVLSFKQYAVHLNLSDLLSGMDELGDIRPKEMSLELLQENLKNPSDDSPRFINKILVEIQKRWSLPVACLVLGIFAFPLACTFEGVRRQLGVVLSLVFFLLYYSVFSIGLSTGESGTLPPVIGLWLPNILFALAGGVGLFLVGRERTPSIASLVKVLREKWQRGKKRGGTATADQGDAR